MDQDSSAGIEIGKMRDSTVSNIVSINNAGGAVRVGSMDASGISNVTHIQNVESKDIASLVAAVKELQDPEADQLLEKMPDNLQNENFWKKMIDKVGRSAGKIAVAVLEEVGKESIKQYLRSKGINL